MCTGCEEAARVLQGQGVVERVHLLVASTDTPAAAAGGGTAALLRTTSLLPYAGFAMTAKPSVNLLLLLQVLSLLASTLTTVSPAVYYCDRSCRGTLVSCCVFFFTHEGVLN